VINTDWTPTLLAIAGISTTDTIDGENILPILSGKSSRSGRRFFWHFPHYTNQGSSPAGAVREGDWKLIEHYEDGRVELFNLGTDLSEKHNLAASESVRVKKLQAALLEWRNMINAQTNSLNPAFDPGLHRAIYQDIDISRYDPPAADEAEFARVLEWRRQMDAAVRNK